MVIGWTGRWRIGAQANRNSGSLLAMAEIGHGILVFSWVDFSKNPQIGCHLVFRFPASCWAGPGSASRTSGFAVLSCAHLPHAHPNTAVCRTAQAGHLEMGSFKWHFAGATVILPGTNIPRESMIRIKISHIPHRALTSRAEQDRLSPSSVSTLIIKPKWSRRFVQTEDTRGWKGGFI